MEPKIAPPTLVAVLSLTVLSLAAFAAQTPQPSQARGTLKFNRDIRPILSDNCFACHGPDKNKRQAGLRLDLPNPAVVPGDILTSELVRRINRPEGDALQMPPAAFHKKLTPAQKQLLMRWVGEGAKYEAHWSFVPPLAPNKGGGGIDALVRARLAKEKLLPAPQADKRTLLRRLSLDLIGLPPTPKELAAFLADTAPKAYEKQVDRLLASPRFGERMAMPWLDAVRYADTVGYHGDQNMNAWAYRDWVIEAFNKNMPFDQFTRDQLAGDLLPNPSVGQRVATCFNRLNMVTREGGAQPKEYLHKYATDRVRTVGMAWLGLTTGCAECHDHKYDPLTQRDFYSLAAYFADVKQWGVYADYGYTPNPDLRGVNNDYPFFPELTVESPYLKSRIAQKQRELDALGATKERSLWRAETDAFLATHPDGWEPLTDTLSTKRVASVRLELASPSVKMATAKGKKAPPETVTLALKVVGADGKTRPVPIRYAGANRFEPVYRNSFALLGVHRGWRIPKDASDAPLVAVYLPDMPIVLQPGEKLKVELPNLEADEIKLAVSPLAPDDPNAAGLPKNLAAYVVTPRAYLLSASPDPAVKKLEQEIAECRSGQTPVMVTETVKTPLVMRVVPRGNWQDETAPIALPATPGFLTRPLASPAPKNGGARGTRLDLANWLVSKENPLTARVQVNRLWKLFFGIGLSPSIEDLGAQGEPPTYPELLDWLAVEFQKDWNVKRMVRLMVTSATYKQSAKARPELKERDPQNKLLAAQNPRRLEAELVRDNALAIAGLLNPTLGGPPAKPYQPAGYYAPLQFPDREYVADQNDSQWRRGVYTHWQRTFLHPMLAGFDAPNRDEPSCTRTLSNTPQQALTLLNDPEFVEAARVMAARLPAGTDAVKLDAAFQRALARSPKPQEKASLLAFLAKVRVAYKALPDDANKLLSIGLTPAPKDTNPTELAAWASVCRVILNLHETITRY